MSKSVNPELMPMSTSLSSPEDQVALELSSIVDFMRDDTDHIVFRRFEKLNLYNLLLLQHRLTAFDQEISIHVEKWNGPALAEVLPKLENLLKSYNEAVMAQYKMRQIQSPSQRLTSNLEAHANSCLKPLKHELHSQEGWTDLFSLASYYEKGWIQKFVDRHHSLSKLFRKVPGPVSTNHFGRRMGDIAGLRYMCLYPYSERGVKIAEQTIVYTASCILVLAPIFALSFITTRIGKLSVVLACVLLASFVSAVITDNAQKSNLALVAGYTAILVVFLSNNNGSGN